MSKIAILLDPSDNTATCTEEVEVSDPVYMADRPDFKLVASEHIPMWHKIALTDLKKGDKVKKYGEVIGEALCVIAKGGLVNHENIRSIPRDYSQEYVEE